MRPDKEQEIASSYMENHSLIIAGAGSGKTTTLLFKIKNLIECGIKEDEILVISFTNETVNNFIKKCPYKVNVYTFHKISKIILNTNKEIIDEDILKSSIYNYFIKAPKKLRKKIYHIFLYKIYREKKYYNILKDEGSSSLINYFYSLIRHIKTNKIELKSLSIKNFTKNEQLLLYCANTILEIYNHELKENNFIDFDDLIINATNYINKGLYKSKYKHILVDEYQDISKIRLDFLQSLIKSNNSILTAVGDDFQSIYGFSGSNIDLFYDFKNYFKESKIFYITTTYRCPIKIITKAGNFIMKNNLQIKKELKSVNKSNSKINKIYSKNYKKDLMNLLNKYKDTNKNVLVLGRNNYDINFILNENIKLQDSHLIIEDKIYKNIRYLTIHKSKGLEADVVIIICLSNTYNSLPNKRSNELIKKLINSNEIYKYAEERRLFYVGITRTKDKLYLLIDKYNPSIFIYEI